LSSTGRFGSQSGNNEVKQLFISFSAVKDKQPPYPQINSESEGVLLIVHECTESNLILTFRVNDGLMTESTLLTESSTLIESDWQNTVHEKKETNIINMYFTFLFF